MALPGPGVPLSLNDIKGEFGGPASPSLGDYYAGGSYVPAGTTGTYGAVPTSGTISIQKFYGTQKFSISGGSTSVSGSDTRLGAGSKTVTTSSASAGTIVGGTAPFSYLWEYVSGDTFNPNTPTSNTTTFSKILTVAVGQTVEATGVYRCRVTDSASNVIYGPNCTVFAQLTETS